MKRTTAVVVAVTLLFGAGAATTLAQQGRAELRGSVTDEQGGALPGVSILITNQDTGTFREVVSSGDGSYFAGQMLPGTFRITAQLAGFNSFERTDFAIGVGRTLDLDIVMTIGAIEETITVSGAAPLVDLTSSEVGGTINTGDLTELPTGNRSYFAAIALLPGIQFNPSSSLGNDTMIANGQTPGTNNVSVDGAANNDDNSGTWAGGQTRVPLESVQEFQVITNQFDAEFGRARGAVINSITKQGTNEFTGAAFNYYTSEKMTARDYFAARDDLPKPPTSKREFGGVIGGPIAEDQMHFFFSLERQLVAPSRAKVFPTRPELNFTTAESWEAWNTLIRVDHQINAGNTWAFRWLRELAPQFSLLGGRTATLNALEDETDNDQTYVGSWTSVIGSSRVNTVRVSATREQYWRGNPCWRDEGTFEDLVAPGSTAQANCLPQYTFRNFVDNQLTSSQGNRDHHWAYSNTFSWFVPDKMGDHDLKFGATYHNTNMLWRSQNNLNGNFVFRNPNDVLFDPNDYTSWPSRLHIRVGGQLESATEYHTLEAFVQDKWQVTDRLTLSFGGRYDLEVFPLPNDYNPFFETATNVGGFQAAPALGITSPLSSGRTYPIDYNNWAPRTSFAYDVTGDGRSVVRGGYGIFYDKTLYYAITPYVRNTPYNSSFTVSFPQDQNDPNPELGRPLDPNSELYRLIRINPDGCPARHGNPGSCVEVNRDVLNELLPPGAQQFNTGTIQFDHPNREQPYAHQFTIGYERELTPVLSASVDYVRQLDRDTHMRQNLNPQVRAGTAPTDPTRRVDAFGVLGNTGLNPGDGYLGNVLLTTSNGSGTYNALNFQLEKRYANNWGLRAVYALAKKDTNTLWFTYGNFAQSLADLNLDGLWGPSEYDRRHNLTLSGRTEIPFFGGITVSSVLRYMSGAPFHIHDNGFDANMNGIGPDPLPAGSYEARDPSNPDAFSATSQGGPYGAYGPDFFQLDLRLGHRTRWGSRQTLDIFFDIFNITDRANFNNPNGDRESANFLLLTGLRAGSGFPRQAQFGMRWGF